MISAESKCSCFSFALWEGDIPIPIQVSMAVTIVLGDEVGSFAMMATTMAEIQRRKDEVRGALRRTTTLRRQMIHVNRQSGAGLLEVKSSSNTSRTQASRVAEVSGFKKCGAIGPKNKFCL